MILVFIIMSVRGMMNYRKALKLQAFLDMANNQGELVVVFLRTSVAKLPLRLNPLA